MIGLLLGNVVTRWRDWRERRREARAGVSVPLVARLQALERRRTP